MGAPTPGGGRQQSVKPNGTMTQFSSANASQPTAQATTLPAVDPVPSTTPPAPAGPQTLPQQVQGAYTGALDQFGNVANAGNRLLTGSQPAMGQAGDLWSQLAGPGGQLAGMDLSPYMNPYTQNVIDTSMNELNQQEGVQQAGVDDQFARQNAFGGDRMYLQKGKLGGDFADTKSKMLADLYSKNFLNAQSMGQFDIGAKQQTAQGVSQYGLGQAQLGGQLATAGAGGMGDLSSSGFQMANAANASQVAAAQAQQQQQQQAIDAANANYARLLGIPQEYLQAMMGISSGLGNFGTTKTNTQQDPGAMTQIGTGVGILGQIAGMGI